MASASLEARVSALEAEVAQLKQDVECQPSPHSWRRMIGAFANDPIYDEAMKLGRRYRESQRPKRPRPRKRKK
jgi:hypothetical protein